MESVDLNVRESKYIVLLCTVFPLHTIFFFIKKGVVRDRSLISDTPTQFKLILWHKTFPIQVLRFYLSSKAA